MQHVTIATGAGVDHRGRGVLQRLRLPLRDLLRRLVQQAAAALPEVCKLIGSQQSAVCEM